MELSASLQRESRAGVEYYNPGYYSNPAIEAHLKQV